jgi:hypothetical protein
MSAYIKRLGWIKRRARSIEKFYGVDRKLAIFDARRDFVMFKGGQP